MYYRGVPPGTRIPTWIAVATIVLCVVGVAFLIFFTKYMGWP